MATSTPTGPSISRPDAGDRARPGRGGGAPLWLWPWRALVVSLGLWLAWCAASVQLAARASQGGRQAEALVLNPGSTVAAKTLAAEALAAGRTDAAERLAHAAAARAPYAVEALRTLGFVASARGDEAAAGTWLGLAGGLGWRDLPTQLWVADRLIAAGAYADALPRIEAMLRQRREGARETYRLLNNLAGRPAARAAIVARLAQRPPWRGPFLADGDALAPDDLAGRAALIGDLGRTPAPATRAEIEPYVTRLAATGDPAGAHAFWRANVADRRLIAASGLYDGGFAATPDGVPFPFEWSIPEDAAAFVTIDPDAAGNPSLHVSAAGELPSRLVAQALLLGAGDYRLTWKVAGDDADEVHWALACAGGGEIPLLPGRGPAAPVRFVVPAGCAMQLLELRSGRLGGAGALDLRIDDVAVERVVAG